MATNDNSVMMDLGRISFHFDTGNRVAYLFQVVNPVLGPDGIKVVCHWVQDGKLTVSTLGYYENVNAGMKDALQTWERYIIKDGMPEAIVTGALDAADVRDMMLYIQEPELWEEGETPPTVEAVVINPLDVAIEAMSSAVDMLRGKLSAGALHGDVFKMMIDLESSLELIVSMMGTGVENETNE